MSILSTIQSGITRTGLRVVIAGIEKMGKTTFCANAPDALLIPLEVGFSGVAVDKTKMIENFDEFNYTNQEIEYYLKQGQFPYKTLIYDSATALERLIHDAILKRDPAYINSGGKKVVTMESCHGGYGKGYNLANEEFDEVLKTFDRFAVTYGINVILTCHVFSSQVIDPTAGQYDCWDLLLHSPKNQKTYGKRERITQWADIVGFLYEPVFVSATENGVTKAVSQNKGRMLGLSRTPSYVAGNRFAMKGEISIPAPPENGWNAFAHALYQSKKIDVFKR